MSGVAETRESILQSALEVFSKKGYVSATIGTIAKKAGVNNLTVFRHFQGKENLFREVVEEYRDIPLNTVTMDKLVAGKDIPSALTALSDAYFEIMFTNIHIFRIFIVEATHFDWVREQSWRMPPQLVKYLREYLAGLLPPQCGQDGTLTLLTEMFLAHITRLTLQFNKHDSIWAYSPNLAMAFNLKMKPQVEFFANIVLKRHMQTGDTGPNPQGGTTANAERLLATGERV